MTLIGLSKGKCLLAALAATMLLTVWPAQGRCESYSVLHIFIDLARPKKPSKPKPALACCPTGACCPSSVCRGVATLPCCPVSCCPECPTAAVRINKPERLCAASAADAEVLRRMCAVHEQTIQQMHAILAEMQRELTTMRIEMQSMKTQFTPNFQTPYGYPPIYQPMPNLPPNVYYVPMPTTTVPTVRPEN